MKCVKHSPSSTFLKKVIAAAIVCDLFISPSYAQMKPSVTKDPAEESQQSLQSKTLSPQEKLDAIRQGLVEAALDTPTRVQTTTWIDANGSLQESSSFKNGMKVRGVKVMAYERDEAGHPKAQLQIISTQSSTSEQVTQSLSGVWQKLSSLFSTGVAQLKKSLSTSSQPLIASTDLPSSNPNQCESPKNTSQLRHLINFEVVYDRDVQPAFTQVFTSILQKSWLVNSAPSKNNWKMVPTMQAPTMSTRMTAYESALLSAPSGNVPWMAKVYARTDLLPAPGLAGIRGAMGPGMTANLTLEVSHKDDPGLTYQENLSIELEVESQAWRQSRMSSASEQLVRKQVNDWGQKLALWLSCEEVKPTVTAIYQQAISINAGSMAGIKKGDEWIIADPKNFPTQLLGKEGAPQTLLAKVQAVSPYESKLILAAGPSNAVEVNWRAWPADTVVKNPSIAPETKSLSGNQVLQR
jgi:hypothetical protein